MGITEEKRRPIMNNEQQPDAFARERAKRYELAWRKVLHKMFHPYEKGTRNWAPDKAHDNKRAVARRQRQIARGMLKPNTGGGA